MALTLIIAALAAIAGALVYHALIRNDPFDHDGDGKPGGSLPKGERK